MPRYIDADALVDRMKKDPLFDLVERYGVVGVIEAEPTADLVEVVRCKDCKHYQGLAECRLIGNCMGTDGFCSWGERRDDAKHETQ